MHVQWWNVHVRISHAYHRSSRLCVQSANTMSSVLEVLGMSLPYSSSTPALYPGSLFRDPSPYAELKFQTRKSAGMFQGCQVSKEAFGTRPETQVSIVCYIVSQRPHTESIAQLSETS